MHGLKLTGYTALLLSLAMALWGAESVAAETLSTSSTSQTMPNTGTTSTSTQPSGATTIANKTTVQTMVAPPPPVSQPAPTPTPAPAPTPEPVLTPVLEPVAQNVIDAAVADPPQTGRPMTQDQIKLKEDYEKARAALEEADDPFSGLTEEERDERRRAFEAARDALLKEWELTPEQLAEAEERMRAIIKRWEELALRIREKLEGLDDNAPTSSGIEIVDNDVPPITQKQWEDWLDEYIRINNDFIKFMLDYGHLLGVTEEELELIRRLVEEIDSDLGVIPWQPAIDTLYDDPPIG